MMKDLIYYHNFPQINVAALVFTIPLLLLVTDAVWRTLYLVQTGIFIGIFLYRIFNIARSLEDKMSGRERGRVKSASELDITRFENGL